ncbi:MAG: OmpA family protein [Limnochordia bacterium]
MRRRKKSGDSDQASSPLWMTTYSDMVTLLLSLFVLLHGISNVDEGKFQGLMQSIRAGFGIFDGGLAIDPEAGIMGSSQFSVEQQLVELKDTLGELMEVEGLSTAVTVQHEERGLVVRFADQVFFDLGKADLKPEALAILNKIGPILKDIPNPIRIEGHTDNLPIKTAQFPSNWELSVHRATSVIRYMVEELDFDPTKLSAAGYGEYRPVRPNDSAENRAMNRRVDIVIMRMDLWAEEPQSEME